MSSNITVAEGIRIVGYLLEHHPATGYLAFDSARKQVDYLDSDATCWCIVGACSLVVRKLTEGSSGALLWSVIEEEMLQGMDIVHYWETELNDEDRLCFSKQLQKFGL